MLYDKDIVDYLDSREGKKAEINCLQRYIASRFESVFDPNRFQKELIQMIHEGLLTFSNGMVSLNC
jgi:hypothetical protein